MTTGCSMTTVPLAMEAEEVPVDEQAATRTQLLTAMALTAMAIARILPIST